MFQVQVVIVAHQVQVLIQKVQVQMLALNPPHPNKIIKVRNLSREERVMESQSLKNLIDVGILKLEKRWKSLEEKVREKERGEGTVMTAMREKVTE